MMHRSIGARRALRVLGAARDAINYRVKLRLWRDGNMLQSETDDCFVDKSSISFLNLLKRVLQYDTVIEKLR